MPAHGRTDRLLDTAHTDRLEQQGDEGLQGRCVSVTADLHDLGTGKCCWYGETQNRPPLLIGYLFFPLLTPAHPGSNFEGYQRQGERRSTDEESVLQVRVQLQIEMDCSWLPDTANGQVSNGCYAPLLCCEVYVMY